MPLMLSRRPPPPPIARPYSYAPYHRHRTASPPPRRRALGLAPLPPPAPHRLYAGRPHALCRPLHAAAPVPVPAAGRCRLTVVLIPDAKVWVTSPAWAEKMMLQAMEADADAVGGVYDEILCISKTTWNLKLVGDGMDATIVTGNCSFNHYLMQETTTVGVDGPGFMEQDNYL
ncbi:hypothetical protein PR202_gb11677 [Eleusine coracana subsp. coracana]|uniref:Pectinesterase catalytic domain-containing protein n=1 Tax=Eleusine coracana subsp. coracana TaxID=191504 RepID=A0AAV5EMU0_ELECO|nr:hypothetical protein PR202_gb11677 [Eleusine coracana subsp. coracana]